MSKWLMMFGLFIFIGYAVAAQVDVVKAKVEKLDALSVQPLPDLQLKALPVLPVTSDSKNDELQWHKFHLTYRSVKSFVDLLTQGKLASSDQHVMFDEVANIVWVKVDKKLANDIQYIMQSFDQRIPSIKIESRIIFIDQDYAKELGLRYFSGHDAGLSTDEKRVNAPDVAAVGGNVLELLDSDFLDVELAALETAGHAEVISRPSLLTLNRKPAFIQAGEEVPYQETSGGGASTVSFKKAVLSLQVTPTLRQDDTVLLDLQVTQDKPSRESILGVPEINTRAIKTQASVKDGQTIVLGGIYETTMGKGVRRVPILGKIPLVGALFTYKSRVQERRELLIFITPVIIH